MNRVCFQRLVLGAVILATAAVVGGCNTPTGPDSKDSDNNNSPSNDSTNTNSGDGQLTIEGVGSFPLSYMYFEAFSREDNYTVFIHLTSQELDEFGVVPEGAHSVWLELRSPTWPLATGTYTHEPDNGTTTPAMMTFEGDVNWGEDWDEIDAESVVTVAKNGVYTISGDWTGDFGSGGTFALSATPTILNEPAVPVEEEPELGVDVQYEATVSGALTGSFAGSATLQDNNPYEEMYRFAFGVDDLTSEPATSLAWVLVIDTYNPPNNGLAATEYPISGEIGGPILEPDVARLVEQNNRLLYINNEIYRFAGTQNDPGTLTLTSLTASKVEGNFSLTGPFEVSTGSSWEPAGEATLATTFIINR